MSLLSLFLLYFFMNYTQALEQFDFTKNEAITYVALLELGLTNVGPLVNKTGLHRQLVYECLNALEQRGYVSSVTKNNRKHVQAASPTMIGRALEEKTEQAKLLIPELVALQTHALDAVEVQTLYGDKGFMSNLKDVVESAERTDHVMRIIGGGKGSDFYDALGNSYRDYLALTKRAHVRKMLIAPESYAEDFKKKFAMEEGNVLRLMSIGLTSPTYTRMTPEMISIEIYISERDVTIIQIRNQAIAKAYIEHFELLWKQAEEYT